ncbi:MAG: LCP family protein [Cyanobium sp.]|jgi:LCP family protein required for cell wall assembly|nr:LCP family protein [Synechococcaceae cyanobacterium]
MPDRRSRRSPSTKRNNQPRGERKAAGPRWTLGSRTLWLRGGLVLVGALLGLGALGLAWPEQDPGLEAQAPASAASLGDVPRRPVTVLLIGSDSDRIKAPTNGAAPRGPANSDALVLVRINPKGPIQVLNLPVELAVQLPGQKRPQALGSLYRQGGAALVAESVRDLLGLERPDPDRYVVLPRGALRALVNGIGGVELSPPVRMSYQDKTMKYRIDLQGGLQRLSGAQVEQMLRFRERNFGESGRRANHQLVEAGLRERLSQPQQLLQLPVLIQNLSDQVDSNLSPEEVLSLMAAALEPSHQLQFSTLPLSPAQPSQGPLRQLESSAPPQLWPAP